MTDKHLTVYWGEELGRYGFGEGHPLGQDRLAAFRVAAIREGIDRLAGDERLRERLGTAAREDVASRFTIEAAADGLTAAWEAALQSGP